MDAVEFIKERDRMCNSIKSCSQCPMSDTMNYCDLDTEGPKKLVAFVEQRSQDHPRKTMMQDFFEKHPNAPKRRDGTPVGICPVIVDIQMNQTSPLFVKNLIENV